MLPSETGASEDDLIGAADVEAVVSVTACAASGGDEREVAYVTLERDPRRQQQTVRVSNAASRAGRRVRLRVVPDQPPLEWKVREGDATCGIGTAALVRFRAGTLVLESRVAFPKAAGACHVRDAPTERALGSLRALGVVVQLRFAPASPVDRGTAREEKEKNIDERDEDATSPVPATSFRLLDAAITFDDARAIGRAAAVSAGRVALPLARDALLAERTPPTPRTGRSPDVWDPEPAQNADDAAVLATRARRRAEMLHETPRWAGTETACAPLLARREARRRDIIGADVRRDCALEMASRLRLARLESTDSSAPPPAVTESLIDAVRSSVRSSVSFGSLGADDGTTTRASREALESRRAAELRSLEDALDALDDLEGLDVEGLAREAREARAHAEALTSMVRDLEREIGDRGRWDAHESGVETRDVLENGLRRADMERALGRPATKADIDASMAIPAAARARVVAGIDVEKARLTGRPAYLGKLPFA